MPIGPVEVIVLAFPEENFSGAILPELDRLVAAGTIAVVDGLFVRKDAEGYVTFVEFDDPGLDPDAIALAAVFDRVDGLVSDEDVEALTETIEPGSSAAILVIEHSWAAPLRTAVIEAGGVLAADVMVPGEVVEEVLAAVPQT